MEDQTNRKKRRSTPMISLAIAAIIVIVGLLTGIEALYMGATGFAIGTLILLVLPFRREGE